MLKLRTPGKNPQNRFFRPKKCNSNLAWAGGGRKNKNSTQLPAVNSAQLKHAAGTFWEGRKKQFGILIPGGKIPPGGGGGGGGCQVKERGEKEVGRSSFARGGVVTGKALKLKKRGRTRGSKAQSELLRTGGGHGCRDRKRGRAKKTDKGNNLLKMKGRWKRRIPPGNSRLKNSRRRAWGGS